jgi:hypothetical protein
VSARTRLVPYSEALFLRTTHSASRFDPHRNSGTFERFAPSYTVRIGSDLTRPDIRDARFAPYNLRLEIKLERLLQERAPFYVPTRIEALGGERISHRLLIPLSADGASVTHCLLMSV